MFIDLVTKTFTRRGRTAAGATEKPTFEVPGCLPENIPTDVQWTLPNILSLFENSPEKLAAFVKWGFNRYQASLISPEAPVDLVEEFLAQNSDYVRFYFRTATGEIVTPETVRIETVKKTGETTEVNVYRGLLMSLKKMVSLTAKGTGMEEAEVLPMLLANPKFKTWVANNPQ